MNWDLILLLIFALILYLFYRKNKSKFEVQGKIFFIYRTKLGLNSMDKFAKLPSPLLKIFSITSIIVGFLGMIAMFYIIVRGTFKFLSAPTLNQPVLAPVIPGVAIPGLPTLSFFHWIIAIFVVATIHEFSHGFIARFFNVKIKSSGFLFFGPILGAFVEPDEEQMKKKSKFVQLSIFSAGPFSNIITGFIILLIASLFIIKPTSSMLDYKGVEIVSVDEKFPAATAGIKPGEKIISINGKKLDTIEDFTSTVNSTKPDQKINIETNIKNYTIKLVSNPENQEKGFLGVRISASKSELKKEVIEKYGSFLPNTLLWIAKLFSWLWIISLGIALFNLLPLGPVDGGRMFLTALSLFVKDEKKAKFIWSIISFFVLALIFINLWPLIKRLLLFILAPIFGI